MRSSNHDPLTIGAERALMHVLACWPALTAAFVARPAAPCLLPSSLPAGVTTQLMAPPAAGASALSLLAPLPDFVASDPRLGEALVASTMALAKSEADELIEEVFINLPVAFVGLLLAFFVLEYAKALKLESDGVLGVIFKDYFIFLLAPLFSVGFVVAGKVGVLGAGSGVLAKVALDGWNVFASLLLPGAILKY